MCEVCYPVGYGMLRQTIECDGVPWGGWLQRNVAPQMRRKKWWTEAPVGLLLSRLGLGAKKFGSLFAFKRFTRFSPLLFSYFEMQEITSLVQVSLPPS